LFTITALFGFAEVLPHTRLAQTLDSVGSWLYRMPAKLPPHDWRPWVVPAVLLLTCLGLEAADVCVPVTFERFALEHLNQDARSVPCGLAGRGWAELDRDHWPVALLPQLREYEREHPGAGVFNDMTYGGFLIYFTPQLRVFIDDRCELHGNDRIREYAEEFQEVRSFPAFTEVSAVALMGSPLGPGPLLAASAAGFQGRTDPSLIAEWVEKYDLHLALVEKHKPGKHGFAGVDRYFAYSPKWRKIGETEGAVLYERRQ
jgi:hypothetical protein